jgi:hypothetical protein
MKIGPDVNHCRNFCEARHFCELIDALGDISHLDAHNWPETDEDRMRLVILDALIQNGVRVPESVSQALLVRYPAQAVILLYELGCFFRFYKKGCQDFRIDRHCASVTPTCWQMQRRTTGCHTQVAASPSLVAPSLTAKTSEPFGVASTTVTIP